MIKKVSFGISAVAVVSIAVAEEVKRKPNVIMIMADDVGYECFGFSGSKQYKTPNLDRMAENGVLFTHAYSQPLCTPSRCKIMTGQANIRNYSAFRVLNSDEITFGHVMKEAGYQTCIAGKWQLYGHYNKKSKLHNVGMHPNNSGFDEYYLWQIDKKGNRFWKPLLNLNGEEKQFGEDIYGPDVLFDKVTNFIDRNKEKPFFVYYPMMLVHDPFLPTPHSADGQSKDKQKNFEDMVEYMDFLIGKLVKNLEKNGIADDTLIMFTGDNGTNRAIVSELNGKSIRGGKGLMTDAGTRVPFVAYWPKSAVRGKVCRDLIDFSDILPTLAEAGGGSVSTDRVIDGVSFLPQIQGGTGNPKESVYVSYFRINSKKPTVFARNHRWKLYANGKFFDIANDVLEKSPIDISMQNESVVAIHRMLKIKLDAMPQKGQKIGKFAGASKKGSVKKGKRQE